MTKTGRASTTRRPRRSRLTTIFEEGDAGEPPVRWVRARPLRLVTPDELRAIAEAAGLVVEPLAGGLRPRAARTPDDRAVVMVARRP